MDVFNYLEPLLERELQVLYFPEPLFKMHAQTRTQLRHRECRYTPLKITNSCNTQHHNLILELQKLHLSTCEIFILRWMHMVLLRSTVGAGRIARCSLLLLLVDHIIYHDGLGSNKNKPSVPKVVVFHLMIANCFVFVF